MASFMRVIRRWAGSGAAGSGPPRHPDCGRRAGIYDGFVRAVGGLGRGAGVSELPSAWLRRAERGRPLAGGVEAAPLGMAKVSLDGRLEEVNPAFCAAGRAGAGAAGPAPQRLGVPRRLPGRPGAGRHPQDQRGGQGRSAPGLRRGAVTVVRAGRLGAPHAHGRARTSSLTWWTSPGTSALRPRSRPGHPGPPVGPGQPPLVRAATGATHEGLRRGGAAGGFARHGPGQLQGGPQPHPRPPSGGPASPCLQVARAGTCATRDLVARVGGDEFAIVLSDGDALGWPRPGPQARRGR